MTKDKEKIKIVIPDENEDIEGDAIACVGLDSDEKEGKTPFKLLTGELSPQDIILVLRELNQLATDLTDMLLNPPEELVEEMLEKESLENQEKEEILNQLDDLKLQ